MLTHSDWWMFLLVVLSVVLATGLLGEFFNWLLNPPRNRGDK